MSAVRFSFSKALITTTALAFISASCLSSVAFAMEKDEDQSCKSLVAVPHANSQLENFVVSNPTVINSILVFLDPKSLLDMGTTNTYFHQLFSNSAQWEALFQQNLYSSISLTSLQLKSPSRYYALAYFVQEVLLPSAIRQGSEFKIPKKIEWWEDMISQSLPENSPQGNYLQGLIYETCGLEKKAFDAYKKAAAGGHVKAQSKVDIALYSGTLGQGARPGEERLEELKTRAANGDRKAQKWLNHTLYFGEFGQGRRSPQERLDELQERADKGDQHAQYLVSMAFYSGTLGQDARPEQERYNKLKLLAPMGNQKVQKLVNHTFYSGTLGQDARPEQERLDELQERAAKGDQHAQEWVNRALSEGTLGQGTRSQQERVKELISNVKNDITYTYIDGTPWVLKTFIFPLLKSLREGN